MTFRGRCVCIGGRREGNVRLPAKCMGILAERSAIGAGKADRGGDSGAVGELAFRVAGVAVARRCDQVRLRYVLAIEFAGGLTWNQAAD